MYKIHLQFQKQRKYKSIFSKGKMIIKKRLNLDEAVAYIS